jgi:hypothetical protein
MTVQTVFEILVLLYTMTNMASLGLELSLRETMTSLRSARLVVPTLLGDQQANDHEYSDCTPNCDRVVLSSPPNGYIHCRRAGDHQPCSCGTLARLRQPTGKS